MSEQNQLAIITNQAGLAEEKSKQLLSSFADLFNDARQTVAFAKDISVTDVAQVDEMKKARETRLELKSIRVQVEHTRKELKESSRREGLAIDGIANVIKALIVPVEEHLEKQEKFAEEQIKLKFDRIEQDRISKLSKYVDDVQVYQLRGMTEEAFEKLLSTSKFAFEAQKKAEEQAELDRIARAKAAAEEQAKIIVENARLKAEAEAKEKQRAKERQAQEAALQKERNARARVEADLKAKAEAEKIKQEAALRIEQEARAKAEAVLEANREAERIAREQKEAEEKQLQLAPDKQKLESWLITIQAGINIQPGVKSAEANEIRQKIVEQLAVVVKNLEKGIASL